MSGNDFTRTLSPLTIRRNWTSRFNDRILAADLDSHDGTRDSSLGNLDRLILIRSGSLISSNLPPAPATTSAARRRGSNRVQMSTKIKDDTFLGNRLVTGPLWVSRGGQNLGFGREPNEKTRIGKRCGIVNFGSTCLLS